MAKLISTEVDDEFVSTHYQCKNWDECISLAQMTPHQCLVDIYCWVVTVLKPNTQQ